MTSPDSSRYIGEPIDVAFDEPPLFSKKPHCPDRIIWRGETYTRLEVIKQWVSYARRGRMADNMQPEHAAAAQRGSWGVGRYSFIARFRLVPAQEPPFDGSFGLESGRVFEFYYDRAPKDVDNRRGSWFLRREILPNETSEVSENL